MGVKKKPVTSRSEILKKEPALKRIAAENKSKPIAKKAKDYGTVFTLLLSPQLEDIDLKIESKLRIVESLQSKEVAYLPQATQRHIESLSLQAQSLNTEIQRLKREQGDNTNQSRLAKINDEYLEEVKLRRALEQEAQSLQDSLHQFHNNFLQSKEKLEEEVNVAFAKQEKIRTDILLKEFEIKNIKDNIIQTSEELSFMKEMNAHYTESIEKINEDIEAAHTRVHEASIKREHADEVKAKIKETMKEELEMKKAILKYQKRFKMGQERLKTNEKENELLKDLMEKIEHALNIMPDYHKEESAVNLEKILKSLVNPTKQLKLEIKEEKEIESSVKFRHLILNQEIKTKELEIADKNVKIPLKEQHAAEINERIKTNAEVITEKASYLNKQVIFYKNQYDSLFKKSEEFEKINNEKRLKVEKMKKKLEEANKKIEDFLKPNSIHTSVESLNKQIEDLRLSFIKSSDSSKTLEISPRNKQITRVFLQLEALRQEVHIRDTEIVSKLRDKQKAEEKLESLKLLLQKVSSKMKNIEADMLDKINQEIEDKDKQIEVLKEMLRGSHAELKVKQIVLTNYRSKFEDTSRSYR